MQNRMYYRRLALTAALLAASAFPAAANAAPLTLGESESAVQAGSIGPAVAARVFESVALDRQFVRSCERMSPRRVRCEVVARGRLVHPLTQAARRWRCRYDAYTFRTHRGLARVTRGEQSCRTR